MLIIDFILRKKLIRPYVNFNMINSNIKLYFFIYLIFLKNFKKILKKYYFY